jgi:hypothetical protein
MRTPDNCEHCARSLAYGAFKVLVEPHGQPDVWKTLRLCPGCTTRQDRTWRRHYKVLKQSR